MKNGGSEPSALGVSEQILEDHRCGWVGGGSADLDSVLSVDWAHTVPHPSISELEAHHIWPPNRALGHTWWS